MAGDAAGGVDCAPSRILATRRNDLMNDLVRLGFALIGFAVAVVVAGVLLGLIGAQIVRARG
jgi:hypothetical protein